MSDCHAHKPKPDVFHHVCPCGDAFKVTTYNPEQGAEVMHVHFMRHGPCHGLEWVDIEEFSVPDYYEDSEEPLSSDE